jgi:hypothetical protein
MNTPFSRWLRATTSVMTLAVLGACGTGVGNPPVTGPMPVSGSTPQDVYAHAMYQSAQYEQRHVLPLFPAVADAQGMVTVVSVKTAAWPVRDTTLQYEVWVTVVPEVRDSCNDWAQDEQVMRLRQLLGLQPTYPAAWFIEMRVPADSIFRPAADPAINTATLCDTGTNPDCPLGFPNGVSARHVRWFADKMLATWKLPNGYPASGGDDFNRLGYPWTRLGYTYNWHPGSPRYGASEYVVRPGTRAVVTSVQSVQDYCRRT